MYFSLSGLSGYLCPLRFFELCFVVKQSGLFYLLAVN